MNAGMLRDAHYQRLSVLTQPLLAVRSLHCFVATESPLPARGRYTFIHVLLPHGPDLLHDDCRVETASRPTDLLDQSQCTLRLLLDYSASSNVRDASKMRSSSCTATTARAKSSKERARCRTRAPTSAPCFS